MAIETGQTAQLNRIPGVGKKTAERLILELKGKLGDISPLAETSAASAGSAAETEEAVAALMSLGFSRPQAEKAVAKAMQGTPAPADVSEIVRRSLASM